MKKAQNGRRVSFVLHLTNKNESGLWLKQVRWYALPRIGEEIHLEYQDMPCFHVERIEHWIEGDKESMTLDVFAVDIRKHSDPGMWRILEKNGWERL